MAILTPSLGRPRAGAGRRLRAALMGWCVVIAALGAAPTAPVPQATEYQIKAAFLFNFTHFVGWPPETFANAEAPMVIGILGDDPFGSFLDRTVEGEKVNERRLVVRRFRLVEQIEDCHVLFVSQSETSRLGSILGRLSGRSILTVGDNEGFARRGGMIALVADKSRIRLCINPEAAKAAHLVLSSNLLRPAEIVRTSKD